MAKPIFTVGIPNIPSAETHAEIQDQLQDRFNDYHVLVYSNNKDDVKFECFFEKDFNEVTYTELKDYILKKTWQQ